MNKARDESDPVSSTRAIAKEYTDRGWHVFPVDDQKRPRTKNGFKDASLDTSPFTPGDGIGIATGQVSGLVIVDLDEKNGKHGIQAFKDLMAGHPKIITRTVKTPTGGAHLYFKHSGPLKTRIDHPTPGIDFKANGGYIVAPPSVVKSGDFYTVVCDIEPVELPEWLKDVMTAPGRDERPGQPYTAPAAIPSGRRNDSLYRLACSVAAKGIGDNAVLAAVMSENRQKCQPPLDDDEVRTLVQSACEFNKKNPPTPKIPSVYSISDSGAGPGLTELAAADLFVEKLAGGCLYNISTGKWHVWNGKVWRADDRNLVKNRCRTFVKSLYADLGNIDGRSDRAEYLGDVEKLNTRRGIENIVTLAAFQLTKRSEDFDSNPHILNLQNGTIEFTQTGTTFRQHRKEDMCSFIGGCEYHPDEPVPEIWINHAHKIASEDPDLARTHQTMFGYCLEGGNPQEKIVIAYGAGRNGKSVTFRTFSRILGGYAVNVNPLTLMETGNKTTSPERLKMRNARLIIAQEPNKQSDDQHRKDTSVLDSGFLKAASGKDPVAARSLYSNTVEEFTVSGVVVLSTNPLPTVNDRSVAFWDRLVLLPFDHYFRPEERDSHIENKFNTALPGILNWFVQGWENYRKTGTIELCETAKIVLNEYRCADDEYATFLSDCVEIQKGAESRAIDLFNEYESWSKSRSRQVRNQKLFGMDMASRFSKRRTKTGVVYCDIRIRTGQQQVSK